jgi:hypothetical protein
VKRETTKPSGAKKKPAAKKAGKEQDVSLNMPRLERMIKTLLDNLETGDLSGRVSVGDLLKLLQL